MSQSQNTAIIEFLKTGKSLTGLAALSLCGTMKLATRISELKDEGWDILSKMMKDKRTSKRYMRYWLRGWSGGGV